jgi:hypothetical protein
MRCYYTFHSIRFDIQFDKTRYQQFLREQELSEHDIKHLNIHLITDFTLSHFKGNNELIAGGAFFQRGREYVEQENKTTLGFYRPYDPPSAYAAIFLRPGLCYTSDRLNHTFLHETRHHIQHCLKLPCCSKVHDGVANEAFKSRNQPWEIDAEQFADQHIKQVSFLQIVPHRLQRRDLRYLHKI